MAGPNQSHRARSGDQGRHGRGGQQGGQHQHGSRGPSDQHGPSDLEWQALLKKVVLTPSDSTGAVSPELFDSVAQEAAKKIADEGGSRSNKPSQLRKFYDELLMWEERVNGGDSDKAKKRLSQHLPLLRMLNAKAAYAQGRQHVGDKFVGLLRKCLGQVQEDPTTLRHCRLFFEAFMGFYKVERPND